MLFGVENMFAWNESYYYTSSTYLTSIDCIAEEILRFRMEPSALICATGHNDAKLLGERWVFRERAPTKNRFPP